MVTFVFALTPSTHLSSHPLPLSSNLSSFKNDRPFKCLGSLIVCWSLPNCLSLTSLMAFYLSLPFLVLRLLLAVPVHRLLPVTFSAVFLNWFGGLISLVIRLYLSLIITTLPAPLVLFLPAPNNVSLPPVFPMMPFNYFGLLSPSFSARFNCLGSSSP